MKKNYTLLTVLFLALFSYAQTPTINWSYSLPDKIDRTGPAIASDGTIYIASNLGTRNTATSPAKPDNNFFAVNTDGTLKWQTSISEGDFTKPDAILSSPSISADGSIYMGGQYGRIIFRINATTGDTIRTKYINTRMRYTAPAFADNGTVYISGYSKGDKGIRSLSADLQTENWIFGAGSDFNSTPAVGSDGTIYAASTNDNIYAINPDGTEKWSAVYGDWIASAIAIGTDETVYLSAKLNGDGDGVLKAYNSADGTEKWSVELAGANTEQGGPAVAADGTIYLGNNGGTLKAYDPADGSEKWSYTTTSNGPIEVVPAIDNDGNIYFGDTNGIFYVLKSDGTEAYTPLDLGDKINSPAAIGTDGKIYVGATDAGVGKLYELATSATSLASSGWPMFGRNPSHTGNVNAISFSPTINWSYSLPDKIDRTGPAIASDGTIYIASNLGTRNTATSPAKPDNNFFAVNTDGTLKWQTSISEGDFTKPDAILSSPSISADGSIYMGGQYGRIIFRINATTGDTIRTKYINTRMRYTAPAFADNGTVYISGYSKGDKGIRSLSADLQTENWIFGAGSDFNSTPAVGSDGTIYAASTNDNIYAINPDGTEKWSAVYGDWIASAIAIGTDETVYLSAKLNGDGDGVLKAYNSADGTEKWSVELAGANTEQGGPAVAADGTIYLGNNGGTLKAYDPADGSEKWSYTTTSNGPIEVVPAIDNDGNIYFGDTNGIFYVLKSDGTEAYTPLDLGDKINSPAAIGTDGKIYVGATDAGVGKLYELATSATSLASSGWPMFGRNPSHTGNVNTIALSTEIFNSIEDLNIYPNPVNKDGFYIRTTSRTKIAVRLFNILGKEILSKTINNNEKIETQNLKSGIYILKVIQDNKTALSKIIIE